MWMVDPRLMCRQHLLGEHVEIHMLVGTLLRKKSVAGFVENRLIEVHNIRARHTALVREMVSRGMVHRSPLPRFRAQRLGRVDVKGNLVELKRRCAECRAIQRRKTPHKKAQAAL